MASVDDGARTSLREVREIFDTDIDNDSLAQFINMAKAKTDEIANNGDLGDSTLRMIEMNLAAHYATSMDPQPIQEEVADTSFRWKGDREVTDYFRNAQQLDTTETLTEGSKTTPSIDVLEGR